MLCAATMETSAAVARTQRPSSSGADSKTSGTTDTGTTSDSDSDSGDAGDRRAYTTDKYTPSGLAAQVGGLVVCKAESHA